MNVSRVWKADHPVASYVGNANQGLGFYHLEIPTVESTQWLNLNNYGVVRMKFGHVSLGELEVELSEIYYKEWMANQRVEGSEVSSQTPTSQKSC